MIQVKYFARYREQLGIAEEQIPGPVNTVAQLMNLLAAQSEAKAQLMQQKPLLIAVNQAFARPDAPLSPGDEVAFFPPLTGG